MKMKTMFLIEMHNHHTHTTIFFTFLFVVALEYHQFSTLSSLVQFRYVAHAMEYYLRNWNTTIDGLPEGSKRLSAQLDARTRRRFPDTSSNHNHYDHGPLLACRTLLSGNEKRIKRHRSQSQPSHLAKKTMYGLFDTFQSIQLTARICTGKRS